MKSGKLENISKFVQKMQNVFKLKRPSFSSKLILIFFSTMVAAEFLRYIGRCRVVLLKTVSKFMFMLTICGTVESLKHCNRVQWRDARKAVINNFEQITAARP